MRKFIGLIAGIALALTVAGVASAHQAKSITASAVCGGATTIVVKADVWGGVHLVVSVDQTVVYDQAQGGNDQSVRTFTISTTTQPGGHTASAKTSDQEGSVGTEFSTPQPCPTPTPKPTPTPTPPPSPSPTPTPSRPPHPTPTPNVTPPPTSTDAYAAGEQGPQLTTAQWYILGLAALFAIVVLIYVARRAR